MIQDSLGEIARQKNVTIRHGARVARSLAVSFGASVSVGFAIWFFQT